MDEADDQDTTDLHKCVAFICDNRPTLDKSDVSHEDSLVYLISLTQTSKVPCLISSLLFLPYVKDKCDI